MSAEKLPPDDPATPLMEIATAIEKLLAVSATALCKIASEGPVSFESCLEKAQLELRERIALSIPNSMMLADAAAEEFEKVARREWAKRLQAPADD